LVPEGLNHAQYSDYELQLMYGIKNGLKIDWPFVIKSNMVKSQSSGDLSSGDPPYAIFFSRFINNFNVDVIDENVLETYHGQRINLSSLAKLEIVCDLVDSIYKQKDDLIQPNPKEGAEDNP